MFLLFEGVNEYRILEVIPESLEVLIFGVGLILFAIGLRWFMKRNVKSPDGEIKHTTQQN